MRQQAAQQRIASIVEQRTQMRTELEALETSLRPSTSATTAGNPNPLEAAVERRRARHAVDALVDVLNNHNIGENGRCVRCRRWQACPGAEVARTYIAGWIVTGGLAKRTDGDPDAISSRRLAY